ncbi:flagellar hook protein FlgE [Lysinimonas soli]|uniref:Flagellar hook protein FlgE n=1 Tax=Lysinimonas soli TaxID=1074233 RepID=A0ABW0NQY4_9MICO
MLRSLDSGISGLQAHQTMLDVTANNIANVNTTGFKSSSTQFEDTLSQMLHSAGGSNAEVGSTNPAQVGLGVKVAGIATDFTQGSTNSTGKPTDMMISGDGFFTVKSGGQTMYTRAGSFTFDADGQLAAPDGSLVQGWTATNGVVPSGNAPLSTITLPSNSVAPAVATTKTTLSGNLPSDAAVGTSVTETEGVYDSTGASRSLNLTFTKTAAGWDVVGADGTGATGAASMTFANGALVSGGSLTVGGVTVDMSSTTGYAALQTASLSGQDGRASGTLQSYSLSSDGKLVGSYSNGATETIAQIALANFTNPGGLAKAGSSDYTPTIASGPATLGIAGTNGFGTLVGGSLEMSNVDLTQEFSDLIVAQRGFEANARIITTSDQILQDLNQMQR